MKLFYFTDQEQPDNFIKSVSAAGGAGFLQSREWGELMEREGREIIRVGVRADNGQILAVATLIKQSIGAGYFYWYAPRGPVGEPEAIEFLLPEIKKINRRALFLRIEPRNAVERAELTIKKTLDLQPKKTLILDLILSEEELLSAMHQKTRYNIRLAEKKGMAISAGAAADFSEFWRLLNLTGARDNFRLHDSDHYRNLIDADKNFIKLFFARYRGRNAAAGLFCFWGDQAAYLHGASDNEFRNVMASYLLQWSVIKTAKKAGCRYYDFNGIDEQKWPGITRFKLGFGGRPVEYPGTFDVIFKPALYALYNFIRESVRKLRKLTRMLEINNTRNDTYAGNQ